MQIHYLRCFITMNDYQSITKASHILNTTPQNLSRILNKIEEEMNDLLFIRTNNGIQLTASGKAFLEFAKTTVYKYDELYTAIQFRKNKKNTVHNITIYSTNVVNEIVLNDILIKFSNQYPSINVHNRTTDWKDGYKQLYASNSALGFLFYSPEENYNPEYTATTLLNTQIVGIMSENHPLAQRSFCRFADIQKYKLIFFLQTDIQNTEVLHFANMDVTNRKFQFNSYSTLASCYHIAKQKDNICIGMQESFQNQSPEFTQGLVAVPIIDLEKYTCALIKPKNLSIESTEYLLYSYILNEVNQRFCEI